jgi:hypothetical protein
MEGATFVRNQRGIRVNRICASCANKDYQDDTRICLLTKQEVEAHHVCSEWQMSEGLMNAGRSGGVVKNVFTKEIILK